MEQKLFKEKLNDKTDKIEEIIRQYLPAEEGYQKTVLEAMNYSLLAGGKRLRPMFMQETYRLFGGKEKVIEPFMAAIEMIHTYSLVHDDLPAMDNDEYRRGRKTTHVVYGEAMGILAGDGLLNYAFETALRSFEIPGADYGLLGKALAVLAGKAGVYGMIGGQTADIEAEEQTNPLTVEQLLYIHENKTAALIQASMMVGAILAGATKEAVLKIEKCAYNIGIAFQIQDDILDVIGDSKELGKQVGSDEKNHKQTYVTLNGLEQSKQEVDQLSREAAGILDTILDAEGGAAWSDDMQERKDAASFLKELIITLIDRRK